MKLRNSKNRFLILAFVSVLFCFSFKTQACNELCDVGGPSACTDANCAGCADNTNCLDCCGIGDDSFSCSDTPGCYWNTNTNLCQNNSNHDCTVSEVPKKTKFWILGGFLILGGALALFLFRKPQRA